MFRQVEIATSSWDDQSVGTFDEFGLGSTSSPVQEGAAE
jgi:hypothetical protein